jgi:hypothetical protein
LAGVLSVVGVVVVVWVELSCGRRERWVKMRVRKAGVVECVQRWEGNGLGGYGGWIRGRMEDNLGRRNWKA